MKINTDKNCNIVIVDDTEYPVKGLSYEDSVSIYIAQLNETNKTTILYNSLDDHQNENSNKTILLEPQKGGYMTMCHIILPKEDPAAITADETHIRENSYINSGSIDDILTMEDAPGNTLGYNDNPSDPYLRKIDYIINNGIDEVVNGPEGEGNEDPIYSYYFSDGTHIYRRNNDLTSEQVEVQELLEVNPKTFGLRIELQNFFSVCYLRKCYVSLCQKIFNDRAFDKCFNGKVSSQLIYKRDLVWAALNVIQYMVDLNQFSEAQRLLERINGCNGLCSKEETGEQNCGCSQ